MYREERRSVQFEEATEDIWGREISGVARFECQRGQRGERKGQGSGHAGVTGCQHEMLKDREGGHVLDVVGVTTCIVPEIEDAKGVKG